jgi:hypothetical protein
MKTRSVGVELFRAAGRTDRQTDMTRLIVAFRNFANAPKKKCYRNDVPVILGRGSTSLDDWHPTFRNDLIVSSSTVQRKHHDRTKLRRRKSPKIFSAISVQYLVTQRKSQVMLCMSCTYLGFYCLVTLILSTHTQLGYNIIKGTEYFVSL